MAKRRNIKHYLIYGFLVGGFFFGMQWVALNISKLPIKTENYFSETDKIKEGLSLLTTVYCRKFTDWYCARSSYTVEEIEATRDNSFSTGSGKTENRIDFWWVAIKNEGQWSEMMLMKNGETIKCNEILDGLSPKMFGGKLRFCEDENGKMVDREVLWGRD